MTTVPSAWVKSELAWYDLQPRQSGIQAKEIINLRPVGNLITTSYTFEIIPRGGQYIDISGSELYVKAKLTRLDGGPVITEATANKPGNKASLVALGLHSLWQEVEVDLNGLSISDNVRLYSYRSFSETALNATSDMSERLGSELFYPEDLGKGADAEDPSAEDNYGAHTRYEVTGHGGSFQMRGRLHGDIFNCRRLIPDAVPLRIKLHPNTDKFPIHSKTAQVDDQDTDENNYKEKVVIEHIYLRVVYITPTADVYNMNVAQFADGHSAHYPINRIKMRPTAVPIGSLSITLQSIFSGQLPNRLFFGILTTDRVDGGMRKIHFTFQLC